MMSKVMKTIILVRNLSKNHTSFGSMTATCPGYFEANFAAVEHPPAPPPTTTSL